GGWIRLRKATAPLGIVLSVLAMLHLMIPASDVTSVADPSLAIRDWPGLAARVEAARKADGAAWIGTIHYGTDAQLALEHPGAPVAELIERDRFPPTDSSWRADMTRPGLVVDLGRRAADMEALRGCFAQVDDLGYLERGPTPYAVFRVAGPRRDVLNEGCWASMDAMHAENHRYRALGFIPTPPPGSAAGRR
ncbi:MAG TPA: hypothetical protein VHY34_06000, partial [Caulobacteraceae bacterium]|nr:hypothetical protein [Caulobacteraceae bacterium]